jgi:hypothetical protein
MATDMATDMATEATTVSYLAARLDCSPRARLSREANYSPA